MKYTRTNFGRWRNTIVEGIPEMLMDKRKKESDGKEREELIQELYAQIGELSAKLRWLKKNLALTFSKDERIRTLGESEEYSIREQCEMLTLNRSGLYCKPKPISAQKLELLACFNNS